jgi:hypothetical protein
MADDISRKITIDVAVTNDGQEQINQYKAAFDSLRNSISGLSNPLASLSNGLSSIDKELAQRSNSISKQYQDELSRLKKLLDDKQITQEQYNKQSTKLESDYQANLAAIMNKYNQQNKERNALAQRELLALTDKATKDKTEKEKKAAEALANFELGQAKKVADATLSIISNSIKQASEAKIAGLEQDKAAELNNSSLTSAQKLAIEQKYKRQEAQIKIKAFKEEQEESIAKAVINGAIAITKAEAQTGVLGALVIPGIIAETAIQIAAIAAQKPPAYATGGLHYASDGRGGVLAGYSKTDNMNAYLRSGEGVIVSEAMRVPWARNLVSAINVGFGGRDFSVANPGRGYAVGGIFTDGGDANRYYNQPVHDQKNLANSIAYQMINNFPPVYVDVKDINNQQNILAQTINRVNL